MSREGGRKPFLYNSEATADRYEKTWIFVGALFKLCLDSLVS